MSNERRAQLKREKQKRKREEARASRGSRRPPDASAPARPSIDGAGRWPLGECYLSENWTEQGARVDAAIVREHSDGPVAVAFFTVDLRRDGVVEADARAVPAGSVHYAMAQRSERSGLAMRVAEPALVAKLVRVGLEHGRANGARDVAGLAAALAVLGDLDGAAAPEAILVGEPPPPPPERPPSLLGRLLDRLF